MGNVIRVIISPSGSRLRWAEVDVKVSEISPHQLQRAKLIGTSFRTQVKIRSLVKIPSLDDGQ